MEGLLEGQLTPVFQRQLRPELETRSFSVLYTDSEGRARSLDVACQDEIQMDLWLIGLRHVLAQRESAPERKGLAPSPTHSAGALSASGLEPVAEGGEATSLLGELLQEDVLHAVTQLASGGPLEMSLAARGVPVRRHPPLRRALLLGEGLLVESVKASTLGRPEPGP